MTKRITPRALTFLIRRCYKKGMDDVETAELLGCSRKTVNERTSVWRKQEGYSVSERRREMVSRQQIRTRGAGGVNERADLVDIFNTEKSARQIGYWWKNSE